MTKESFDYKIARVAAKQYGVVSRDQVLGLGVTKRVIQVRLESGRWERLHMGVYRLAGTPSSWHQRLMVGCLACKNDAVVSHRSAAALRKLPGFDGGPVELSVPNGRGRCRGFTVHRMFLPMVDVTVAHGIPVTTTARTLIDLASVEPASVVEEALDDALRRQLVSLARLRWRVDELAKCGRPGIAAIRPLLDARGTGVSVPQSVFERRLLRLLAKSGLSMPITQHEVRVGRRLVAIIDFAFPEVRLGIEADGYRWHSGRLRWEHDLVRRNALTALGWRVLHVTWDDVARRPGETVQGIKAAFAQATADAASWTR